MPGCADSTTRVGNSYQPEGKRALVEHTRAGGYNEVAGESIGRTRVSRRGNVGNMRLRASATKEHATVEKTTLWSRVGGWFRVGERGDGASEGVLGSNLREVEGTIVPSSRKAAARHEISGRERLEEGFTKVVELVESIQGHMRTQDERTEKMVESLGDIAESLAKTPEHSRAQVESLEQMKQQMEGDAARARRLEENLAQLPGLADAQRETMIGVGRQMDELRISGESNATAVCSLGEAISGLDQSTATASDALREIQRESASREDRLTDLLRDQNRRLTLFAYSAFGLAVIVSLACLAALLK